MQLQIITNSYVATPTYHNGQEVGEHILSRRCLSIYGAQFSLHTAQSSIILQEQLSTFLI